MYIMSFSLHSLLKMCRNSDDFCQLSSTLTRSNRLLWEKYKVNLRLACEKFESVFTGTERGRDLRCLEWYASNTGRPPIGVREAAIRNIFSASNSHYRR